MTLGQLLHDKRDKKRLSLRDLEERARVSRSTLCNLENDRDTSISDEALIRLAKAVEADIDTVLLMAGRIPADVQAILLRRQDLLRFIRQHATHAENESGAHRALSDNSYPHP